MTNLALTGPQSYVLQLCTEATKVSRAVTLLTGVGRKNIDQSRRGRERRLKWDETPLTNTARGSFKSWRRVKMEAVAVVAGASARSGDMTRGRKHALTDYLLRPLRSINITWSLEI